jgi:hypothetical protein
MRSCRWSTGSRTAFPNFDFSLTIERREESLRQLINFEINVAAFGRPPTDP